MVRFKYRYCQVHMARFVSRDLSPAARRRVARYIDECQDCYREYTRHREFNHRLAQSLPALGSPKQARLDSMWDSLQTQLSADAEPKERLRDFARRGSLQFSYGLAAVAICLALLLPVALGYRGTVHAADLPPAPQLISLARTPDASLSASGGVMAATQPRLMRRQPSMMSTPAPG